MTVPSHPVQVINRICFGTRLGRLAWPHVTGGMDTDPPDDDSMGGGDESEQGTRQKMHFCQRPVQQKLRGPQKRNKFRVFFSFSNNHLFSFYIFFRVCRVHTGNRNEGDEAKDILAIRQDKGL